jgi:hypothetical protein
MLIAVAVAANVRVANAATEGPATPIGVAQVDITPEDPVRMYGYASRKTESEGIVGRLHAKALAIGDGDDLAMVFMSDEVVVDDALRMKREMDGSRLWITAYTNQIRSYIASERILEEGGYEARNSLSNLVSFGEPQQIKPSMEERIIRQVAKLLPETFKKRQASR